MAGTCGFVYNYLVYLLHFLLQFRCAKAMAYATAARLWFLFSHIDEFEELKEG
eukprot:gene20694-7625_t